ENGHGGTAVLWSDDYTNFRGTVLAKGGAQSGSGGQVETSSHRNLQASGTVDASARAGRGGEWLLDPTDVTIVGTGADTGIGSATADGTGIFTPTAGGAQILNTSIESQLNAGTNVTVRTSGADTAGQSGNITVNANITKSAGADATLTLLADNNISTGDRVSIGASAGKLNLNLLAGNTTNNASISLGNFINISLNGGDFLADAGNADSRISLTYRNNGQIQGGNVTLNVSRGLSGYAYRVQADNDLTINGPVTGSTGWGALLGFTAGGRLAMNSPGSISLKANETANGGGRLLISGDKGVSLNAADGGVTLQAASSAQNGANITSANGPVSISGMRQDGSDTLTLTNVNLSNGNISAKNDITLKADAGSIAISGTNATVKANITSDEGNISVEAYNPSTGGVTGVSVRNAQLNAEQGNININGTTPGTMSGVRFTGVDLKANTASGEIVIYGESKGGNDTYDEKGSVYFGGTDTFTAKNINITGRNLKKAYSGGGGIAFDNSHVSFNGDTSVSGSGDRTGVTFWNVNHLDFIGGNASLNAKTTGPGLTDSYYGTAAIVADNFYNDVQVYFNLTQSNLKIEADASSTSFGQVPALGLTDASAEDHINGFIFQGEGDVDISGVSTDGNAVDASLFDNTALVGSVALTGTSQSGTGV
ncbi:hypothetical protein MLB10_004747, partial [Salmonella enterica]|nr:hypothetical protein [Salmonella enterica]